MLIDRDDIRNDATTLSMFFFNVCLHLRLFLLRADWRNLTASFTHINKDK